MKIMELNDTAMKIKAGKFMHLPLEAEKDNQLQHYQSLLSHFSTEHLRKSCSYFHTYFYY